MVETQYTRCGKVITDIRDPENPQVIQFKSINKAKKESRTLQGAAPGQGLLKVIPHKQRQPDWVQASLRRARHGRG